jgi:hypothetical protein
MDVQNLLTIFIALTALAILIQVGILVGFVVVTKTITRQANRAVEETKKMVDPVNRLVNSLQTTSNQLTEMSDSIQNRLRQFNQTMARAQVSWRETLDRWGRRSA